MGIKDILKKHKSYIKQLLQDSKQKQSRNAAGKDSRTHAGGSAGDGGNYHAVAIKNTNKKLSYTSNSVFEYSSQRNESGTPVQKSFLIANQNAFDLEAKQLEKNYQQSLNLAKSITRNIQRVTTECDLINRLKQSQSSQNLRSASPTNKSSQSRTQKNLKPLVISAQNHETKTCEDNLSHTHDVLNRLIDKFREQKLFAQDNKLKQSVLKSLRVNAFKAKIIRQYQILLSTQKSGGFIKPINLNEERIINIETPQTSRKNMQSTSKCLKIRDVVAKHVGKNQGIHQFVKPKHVYHRDRDKSTHEISHFHLNKVGPSCNEYHKIEGFEKHDCMITCNKCDAKFQSKYLQSHDCINELKQQLETLKLSMSKQQLKQNLINEYFPEIYAEIVSLLSELQLDLLDVKIENVKIKQTEEYKYVGQVNQNDQKEGYGYLFDFNKQKFYEGNFLNDLKHGRGRSYIINGVNRGNLYLGEFFKDKYHGKGRYLWPDQDEYTGEFQDNYQNGFGVYKYANGDIYAGFFQDNTHHGYGMHLKQASIPDQAGNKQIGDLYIGEYKEGQSEGIGLYIFSELKEKYVGEWLNGAMDGIGLQIQRSEIGIKYIGEFKNDLKSGMGLMFEGGIGSQNQLTPLGKYGGGLNQSLIPQVSANEETKKKVVSVILMENDQIKIKKPLEL
ncbi:UNKNOWN [Stylonychia lemnae]|uniref:Morn repeat protein n=1 Tax=Stylonychia lemnae TaxID=5949 RepID=A0A078A0Y5_STYLE|nr:UNKNOWN [Stylonychia lemnae]|eukprot:CDW75856.1 UNKNOWN [Stylonychia lemnae]